MREAGLPRLIPDEHGAQTLTMGSKGVVRQVHPDRNRVDIETEDGSYLTEVLVLGPYFPEVHKDGEAPQHVVYLHVRGQADAFCWPETHRRLLGPPDTPKGSTGESEPERRYFHTHGYILRWGDVTIRISRDNRFVVETEEGDFILLDKEKREIELRAPTVYIGTETETRLEYQRDKEVRVRMPNIYLGKEAIGDADGVTYRADDLIHLVSPFIKLTADEIVLDPVSIKLGHGSATERAMLGDLWMAFFNAFVTLFNNHRHTNVQTGGGTSGPPNTSTPAMTDAILSDVTRISKTGTA